MYIRTYVHMYCVVFFMYVCTVHILLYVHMSCITCMLLYCLRMLAGFFSLPHAILLQPWHNPLAPDSSERDGTTQTSNDFGTEKVSLLTVPMARGVVSQSQTYGLTCLHTMSTRLSNTNTHMYIHSWSSIHAQGSSLCIGLDWIAYLYRGSL